MNPKNVCQGGSVIHKIFCIVINPKGGAQRAKALFGSIIKRPFPSLFQQETADLYQVTGTLLLHLDCFSGRRERAQPLLDGVIDKKDSYVNHDHGGGSSYYQNAS